MKSLLLISCIPDFGGHLLWFIGNTLTDTGTALGVNGVDLSLWELCWIPQVRLQRVS